MQQRSGYTCFKEMPALFPKSLKEYSGEIARMQQMFELALLFAMRNFGNPSFANDLKEVFPFRQTECLQCCHSLPKICSVQIWSRLKVIARNLHEQKFFPGSIASTICSRQIYSNGSPCFFIIKLLKELYWFFLSDFDLY